MQGVSDEGGEPERLREGDPATWEAFYERVYPMMLAYSQRRLGYNELARDAVSEALARTVTTVSRMAELGTTPEAWSFGILRHVVVDEQRKSYRDRHVRDSAVVAPADPSESVSIHDEHANVRQAFARLSDFDRELLELRVVAGLSSEEVATALEMKPGAVRMAQSRALERLRKLMPGEAQS